MCSGPTGSDQRPAPRAPLLTTAWNTPAILYETMPAGTASNATRITAATTFLFRMLAAVAASAPAPSPPRRRVLFHRRPHRCGPPTLPSLQGSCFSCSSRTAAEAGRWSCARPHAALRSAPQRAHHAPLPPGTLLATARPPALAPRPCAGSPAYSAPAGKVKNNPSARYPCTPPGNRCRGIVADLAPCPRTPTGLGAHGLSNAEGAECHLPRSPRSKMSASRA